MPRLLTRGAGLLALSWASAAWAVGSTSGAAASLAGKMRSAGIAFGTVMLVLFGILLMLGMGNRSQLVTIVVGLGIVLSASFLAGLVS